MVVKSTSFLRASSKSKKSIKSALRSALPASTASVTSSKKAAEVGKPASTASVTSSKKTTEAANVHPTETRQEGEDENQSVAEFTTVTRDSTVASEGLFDDDETTCVLSVGAKIVRHETLVENISTQIKQQQLTINTKKQELKKWKAVLEKQRENVDEDIKKLQSDLIEATKARQDTIDGGTRKWEKLLAEATAKRQEKYEEELAAWQVSFGEAATPLQFKTARQAWKRLEASRQAPIKEMKVATKMLEQLEQCVDVDTKEMKKLKKMIRKLEIERDTPAAGQMSLTSKEESLKFIRDVMDAQDALAAATERHEKDCLRWKVRLDDASFNTRLVETRDVPTAEMKKAIDLLERLEGEKDAYRIMKRHAGCKVIETEQELMRGDRKLKEMQKQLCDAMEALDLQPRYASFESSAVSNGDTSTVASESSADSDTYAGTFASTVGDANTCTIASSTAGDDNTASIASSTDGDDNTATIASSTDGDDNTATIASTAVSSHEVNKRTMKQGGFLHGVLSSVFCGA